MNFFLQGGLQGGHQEELQGGQQGALQRVNFLAFNGSNSTICKEG